jgi:hypothetical protein
MKWVLWAFLIVVGVVVVIIAIGWLLPREHVASRAGRGRDAAHYGKRIRHESIVPAYVALCAWLHGRD